MEYWADVKLSDKLEEWILLQGATVYPSNELPSIGKDGQSVPGHPVVMFGGRRIHFYSGRSRQVRIFFNQENESTRTLLILLFPDAIESHNFKDMSQII